MWIPTRVAHFLTTCNDDDDDGDGGDGVDDGGGGGGDDDGDDKSSLTWSVEAVGEALEKRLEASSRRLSRGHRYQQCLQCLLGG